MAKAMISTYFLGHPFSFKNGPILGKYTGDKPKPRSNRPAIAANTGKK